MLRAAAVLFGAGAAVGSALDALHTHSGTTSYARPVAFKMAWWTPGLFGLAGLSTGLAYPAVERLVGRSITRELTPRRVVTGFAGFAALYAASAFLPASNAVKLAVVGGGAAALAAHLAPTREAAAVAAAAAVVGPTIEIGLVASGLFRHHQPDALGIPMWLPALYAAGTYAFGAVGKMVVAALKRPSEPAAASTADTAPAPDGGAAPAGA